MSRVRSLIPACVTSALASACARDAEPTGPITGGANLSDKTNTVDGEKTTIGAMSLSPDGRFAVLHDATTTTVVEIATRKEHVRTERWDRLVFGLDERARAIAYVSRPGYGGVVAVDLESGAEKWSLLPAYYNEGGAQFFRLAQGGRVLVAGDVRRVFRIDTQTGAIKGLPTPIGEFPQFALVSHSGKRLFVVAETRWASDDEPRTPFTSVDLETGDATTIEIPNCAAPPAVLNDDSRVFVSPTFCQRGASFEAEWQGSATRGVDPVSVIDIAPSGAPSFKRNLPGFGPITLSADGAHAIAFLDAQRLDPKLFDDKSQVPGPSADRYHLMWIEPRTERFSLQPIGQDLPRFAFSADGTKLLVDSTVIAQRRITLLSFAQSGPSVRIGLFESTPASSLLGVLDVKTRAFRPLQGPRTSLDRFVQLPGGRTVYTLAAAGPDAPLRMLDLAGETVHDTGRKARDLALLADGRLVLRDQAGALCITRDGSACE